MPAEGFPVVLQGAEQSGREQRGLNAAAVRVAAGGFTPGTLPRPSPTTRTCPVDSLLSEGGYTLLKSRQVPRT